MRSVNGELLRRLKLAQQTAYQNADPGAVVWITRPTTTLTDGKFLDRELVGTYSGLSASSIAVRRPRKGRDADRVYIAYVADGTARVRYAAHVASMEDHIWKDADFSAPAVDVSIAFDGTMPKSTKGAEFVTEEQPWVFWVTPEGELKGSILGLLGETTLASANCSRVSAIRATWSDIGGIDFGLCVFFILSGALYYRQLIAGEWMDAEPVSFGPSVTWADIAAFRTWDYRVGVQGLTTGGAVYELFSQYQGFAKHGSEHMEIQELRAAGALIPIQYHDTLEREHISIAAISSTPAIYGGLYRAGYPQIVRAYNVEDANEDWGKTAVFVFDRHLLAADVAAQPSAFRIVDSRAVVYFAQSAVLGADGMMVTLHFLNFNNANGTCRAVYTPGTVRSMADVPLAETQLSWIPQNLVPPAVPAPEPISATNIGSIDIGAWEIGDGAYIKILFTEDLTGAVTGNENHFTVTWSEYDFVPGGALVGRTGEVYGTSIGEVETVLVLEMDTLDHFYNAAGRITVEYDGAGTLQGEGGSVEPFTLSFLPHDLVAKPNQNPVEHLEITAAAASGVLTRVYYTDTTEREHIEITSISADGVLTRIGDL